jgi:hypothetical protein
MPTSKDAMGEGVIQMVYEPGIAMSESALKLTASRRAVLAARSKACP